MLSMLAVADCSRLLTVRGSAGAREKQFSQREADAISLLLMLSMLAVAYCSRLLAVRGSQGAREKQFCQREADAI